MPVDPLRETYTRPPEGAADQKPDQKQTKNLRFIHFPLPIVAQVNPDHRSLRQRSRLNAFCVGVPSRGFGRFRTGLWIEMAGARAYSQRSRLATGFGDLEHA